MSKLAIFAFVSSSLLMAAEPDPVISKESASSKQQKVAERKATGEFRPLIVGNEKTVGASPETFRFPAVADEDQIGNAKTVGGSGNYTRASNDGVGKVGNNKTVGGQ